MLYLLAYYIKRIPREGFKSLTVPALAFALVFLINVLAGVKARMEAEYEYVLTNHNIIAEVSDGDGTNTDRLQIGDRYLRQFFDNGELWSLHEFVDDVMLRRTLHILEEEGPSRTTWLYGVDNELALYYFHNTEDPIEAEEVYTHSTSDPDGGDGNDGEGIDEGSDGELDGDLGGDTDENSDEGSDYYMDEDDYVFTHYNEDVRITYYDGFDESLFSARNLVCVVSEDVLEWLDAGVLRFSIIAVRGPNTRVYEYIFHVAGIAEGIGEGMIFIPYQLVGDIVYAVHGWRGFGRVHVLYDGQVIPILFSSVEVHVSGTPPLLGSLIGITNPQADSAYTLENGASITYYDGFDESMFLTDESLCIVSTDMLDIAEDGILRISVISAAGAHSEVVEAELTIAGIVDGAGVGVVYAPFWTVSELAQESDQQPPHSELLRATVSDNRQLNEFKENASRSFSRTGVFFNPLHHALTIYDAEFYDKTETSMQAIFFIDIATPFVYVISICVGFVASFLLMRQRKSEFALMRSAGVRRMHIFFGALVEQAVLLAVGAALGCTAYMLTWGSAAYIDLTAYFIAFYMLGALFSAGKAAGTDVLKILRDRE